MSRDHRPVFLNLFQIRLPVQGVASIAHRISGILLFLFIPFVLSLLMHASASEEGYAWVLGVINMAVLMPVFFLIAWAFWHHLFAGVRHLLLDLELGVEKQPSRISALLVISLGLGAALASTLSWYLL